MIIQNPRDSLNPERTVRQTIAGPPMPGRCPQVVSGVQRPGITRMVLPAVSIRARVPDLLVELHERLGRSDHSIDHDIGIARHPEAKALIDGVARPDPTRWRIHLRHRGPEGA